MKTFTFEAQGYTAALHTIKNSTMETIYDAIVNKGIGGQGYVWYTDSEGTNWVIMLHSNCKFRENAQALQCFNRDEFRKRFAENRAAEASMRLLKTAFSVDELARLADQCTTKSILNYHATLEVNGEVVKGEVYNSREEAEMLFMPSVTLKAFQKAEVRIEERYDWTIACEAYKQCQREHKC